MSLEEKYKELQKQNKIRVICNKEEAEVDEELNVTITYTCGETEKTPLLKILNYPDDYEALLHKDTIFQKTLRCKHHCTHKLKLLKLKPLKSEDNHRQIWNLEHGRAGTADLTIRLV